jgi:hypothetical protein
MRLGARRFSALEAPAWDLFEATGSDRPRQRQNDHRDHGNGDQYSGQAKPPHRAVVRDQRIFAPMTRLTEDDSSAEHAHLNFVSRQSSSGAEDAARNDRTKERHMITRQLVLAGCTAVLLSVATAHAGPCNTDGKSAQDAGAGPHTRSHRSDHWQHRFHNC